MLWNDNIEGLLHFLAGITEFRVSRQAYLGEKMSRSCSGKKCQGPRSFYRQFWNRLSARTIKETSNAQFGIEIVTETIHTTTWINELIQKCPGVLINDVSNEKDQRIWLELPIDFWLQLLEMWKKISISLCSPSKRTKI